MKKIIIIVIALLIIGFVTFGSGNNEQVNENKVGATIFPIYDITRQIAGEEFETVLILPPGASPHTFDLQPSVLNELQGAKTVFAIGHGLDNWVDVVADSIDSDITTLYDGIDLLETFEGHHDDDHEEDHDVDDHGHYHGPIDPHYWLSIHNAEKIAFNVSNKLSELDPENAELYIQRAEAYAEELEALETELQEKVVGLAGTNIISFHDAWYYFAAEFGLNLIGTFEPAAGEGPTPQYLANLQSEILENNVSVLFMEPQLSTVAIESFANDNNLGLSVIDPLGGVGERDSYINLMRYNVEQVVNSLK